MGTRRRTRRRGRRRIRRTGEEDEEDMGWS